MCSGGGAWDTRVLWWWGVGHLCAQAQRALVATKQRDKDESEYQWGMTKAQLAIAESDRSTLQVPS